MRKRQRPQCPPVIVPDVVWRKIVAYTMACPVEIGGLGTAEYRDGSIVVTDAFLLEQKVSGIDTTIDPVGFAAFYRTWLLDGKDEKLLRFWWHSHADMASFFSPQDHETAWQYTLQDWLVSLVVNRRQEAKVMVTGKTPFPIIFPDEGFRVFACIDNDMAMVAAAEVAAKVTMRRRWSSLDWLQFVVLPMPEPPELEPTADVTATPSEGLEYDLSQKCADDTDVVEHAQQSEKVVDLFPQKGTNGTVR